MATPISILPSDALICILRHLSPDELLEVCRVSKRFNSMASDDSLWNSYPIAALFPTIGKGEWESCVDLEKYELEFDEDGPRCMDKSVYVQLKRLSSKVADHAGITLLTIPKGLTLSKLIQIAQEPLMGKPIRVALRSRWGQGTFKGIIGEIPNSTTYTVVIANSNLKRSKGCSWQKSKAIVSKLGCERPGLLPATALRVLSSIISSGLAPICLMDRPTFCAEQILGCTTGAEVKDGCINITINVAKAGVGAQQKLNVVKGRITGIVNSSKQKSTKLAFQWQVYWMVFLRISMQ